MVFSYNWLQSFFIKKLPKPDKLAEVLTMHSFEVEGLKKIGRPARNASRSDAGGDWALDIDVLSNRGSDCFSHLGIAREISAILNLGLKNTSVKLPACSVGRKEDKSTKAKDYIKVEVKEPKLCSRYTARVITDVKVGKSPKYIQERLAVCGLHAINNIVDAANYVMLETGQPMHAFDFGKVSGTQTKKIIVRKARKGEGIVSLDDEKYKLDEDVLVIADGNDALAIAGIKGGKKAEIDSETKDIVLEAANFDYHTIRKASKKLGLKTDASWRFEHTIDPNLTEIAIDKTAAIIQEIAGGKIAKDIIDYYPKKVLPKKIKLDLDYVERLLGAAIPQKEIVKILKSLEFLPTGQAGPPTGQAGKFQVTVPTFRRDVSIPEDVIEEIARIYGYEKINPVFPSAVLIPPEKNEKIFWANKIRDILKEIGFSEVYNYSFLSSRQANNTNLIEVENPMSIEQKYLRNSLMPNLIKNVENNFKNFDEIKIFEIGKIFNSPNKEKTMLCAVIAKENNNQGFYELKGVIDSLLNQLGISDVWYDEHQPSPEESKLEIWEQGRCAEIKISGKEIGFLGEIENELAVFDINFEELMKQCSEEQIYQPVSRYPSSVRDLAVLVPKGVKVIDVLNKINNVGPKIVVDVDLFDIYEGRELPAGKKNFAFHIVYQSKTRTLLAKEIDEIQEKIINALESEPEWEVRK
ncbi:phenylalanine--tRNA ligase subunit beta [Candidatus Parcubacteria bacterium]|nr:phenylalanine--tRNA ligase subunit beta [Candidatus Parcubacteria bacterium]